MFFITLMFESNAKEARRSEYQYLGLLGDFDF